MKPSALLRSSLFHFYFLLFTFFPFSLSAAGVVHPELKTIYVNDFETEEPELILPQLGIEAQMLVRDDTFCTTTDEAKFGRRALQVNTPDGTGGIYWVEALGDRP